MNYSFQCGCGNKIYRDVLRSPRSVPPCRHCNAPFIACDSPWDSPRNKIKDLTITPGLAKTWLKHCNPTDGPNDHNIVLKYARLMKTGRWKNITLDWGGIHCPFVFDPEGHLRYGLQRLEAVVLSQVSISATVVYLEGADNAT